MHTCPECGGDCGCIYGAFECEHCDPVDPDTPDAWEDENSLDEEIDE